MLPSGKASSDIQDAGPCRKAALQGVGGGGKLFLKDGREPNLGLRARDPRLVRRLAPFDLNGEASGHASRPGLAVDLESCRRPAHAVLTTDVPLPVRADDVTQKKIGQQALRGLGLGPPRPRAVEREIGLTLSAGRPLRRGIGRASAIVSRPEPAQRGGPRPGTAPWRAKSAAGHRGSWAKCVESVVEGNRPKRLLQSRAIGRSATPAYRQPRGCCG